VVFKNLTTNISDSFNDLFYHCDFLEINSLARGELGIDEDYLEALYPTKGIDDFVELFSLLESRMNRYGDSYPFDVNYDDKRLQLKSNLTEINKLYIFFVMCSRNEKIIYQGNTLESDFEHISTLALKKYLPTHAAVYHFGKSSYQEDRYSGKLTEKITLLAEDIKCDIAYDTSDFSVHDTGDGGLDVVAWIPFPGDIDNFMHIPVFLGQCAIGKDWKSKHHDVEKMKSNIHFPLGTASMMYVSHDLRKDNGKFKKSASRAHLLFDRFRLIQLVSGDEGIMAIIRELTTFTQVISTIDPDNVDIMEV
jgi:hypothetical protein